MRSFLSSKNVEFLRNFRKKTNVSSQGIVFFFVYFRQLIQNKSHNPTQNDQNNVNRIVYRNKLMFIFYGQK